MIEERDVLPPEEFQNFRNVQAIAALFTLFGCMFFVCGIMLLKEPPKSSAPHALETLGYFLMTLVGFLGFAGGVAALAGSRRFAPLMYVMGAFYVLAFPVGTFLSIVLFRGLGKYLDAKDKLRVAAKEQSRSSGK